MALFQDQSTQYKDYNTLLIAGGLGKFRDEEEVGKYLSQFEYGFPLKADLSGAQPLVVAKSIIMYRLNHTLHRLDGPAVSWRTGTEFYYLHGRLLGLNGKGKQSLNASRGRLGLAHLPYSADETRELEG